MFGTAYGGGAYNYGAVFELSNPTGNAWIENTLYSFGGGPDGQYPQANVVFGPGGALYGTTVGGGAGSEDGGTIIELAPPAPAGGVWTESVLYGFPSGVGVQVDAPFGAVLFDKNGNLYSTARGEYLNVAGGVVELMPLPSRRHLDGIHSVHIWYAVCGGQKPFCRLGEREWVVVRNRLFLW